MFACGVDGDISLSADAKILQRAACLQRVAVAVEVMSGAGLGTFFKSLLVWTTSEARQVFGRVSRTTDGLLYQSHNTNELYVSKLQVRWAAAAAGEEGSF